MEPTESPAKSPSDTSVFAKADIRTITVDLTEGQWAIETSDPEQPFEGPPSDDPHTILITAS